VQGGQFAGPDCVPWCSALAYCENLDFAGHNDWRLPDLRELQSLVDYGRTAGPAIDSAFGTLSDLYWSSTYNARLTNYVWDINFGNGLISQFNTAEDHCNFVRAVRNER